MNTAELISILVVTTAFFAYINLRFLKMPTTIGIMIMGLAGSVMLVALGNVFPELANSAKAIISGIDFRKVLLNSMLSLLLYAGAIHINVDALKKQKWIILTLSTIGLAISTIVVAASVYFLFGMFRFPIPFIYCLLFGALISPTDPIAVLSILKSAKIPPSLEVKVAGESLFNDGVAVVVFITVLEIINSGSSVTAFFVGKLFLQEAGGGIALGIALGYLGFFAMRPINDYKVEILITLAIVFGGYSIAELLGVSGPLAMVVAGIITGNKVKDEAMSSLSKDYLEKFWELIDEILNALLFLLIGLEILVIKIEPRIVLIGIISIAIVLGARWLSVFLPVKAFNRWFKTEPNSIAILTWGGLRGGLSVALALSLSEKNYRDEFVLITYMIVIFSIVVQGLTIGKLTSSLTKKDTVNE